MFQTFAATTSPQTGAGRLAALRAALADHGVDGMIVPRADAHQGEYVAARDERLAWLTGFTGSAGFCVVLPNIAGLFIDGRYTLQVRSQADCAVFTPVDWPKTTVAAWIAEHGQQGQRIAFDPWLHTPAELVSLRAQLDAKGVELVRAPNFIDKIWHDQPAAPAAPIKVHPSNLAGEPNREKRIRLARELRDRDLSASVLSLPDSIAWLLNIRGGDIARTPVPLTFAILHNDGAVELFNAAHKADDAVRAHLGDDVILSDMAAFGPALDALSGPIAVDLGTLPLWISDRLEAALCTLVDYEPCRMPKALKNTAEIDGAKAAHLRDGAAMAEFLCWLDAEAPKGTLTEIDIVEALEAKRRATNQLQEISFETISGAGPNGAIVHYRVTEDTNRALHPGELILVDSGGQYLDGTTDITRTVSVGAVDPDAARAFTLVLRGMIAISMLRWPIGLGGAHLDALARAPLWSAGMDYNHGTGHGVGAYLGVHEGPQSLSRRSTVPFEPGMILSNEPGYYREGGFGIRIENLLVVQRATSVPGGDIQMLSFATLTLCPIDQRLIVPTLLTPDELKWLNAYHADVLDQIGPLVSDPARGWLTRACAPITPTA